MSYQLIHTSALNLLDSQASGYGTVARSETLPWVLSSKLGALSVFREPRGGAATAGPQFSYHIIEHGAGSWHVLTCVQPAGADYSGRACHIAHHLALTHDEVAAMLANPLRPTPAGLTLALLCTGFWKSSWKGAPAYIAEEPELSPGDLPDATAQPTWKRLTGHKANARAFFTAPFDRECLITVAPGTPVQDVLSLFHESDWLTHGRGWGMSYTTAADDADTFTETLRMVSSPASPLVQRAIRTGHPVLRVEQGLEIPLPAPEPPGSTAVSPEKLPGSAPTLVRTLARSRVPYHYTEEADWLLYDVPYPRRRTPWVIVGCCGVLLTGAVVLSTLLLRGADNIPLGGEYIPSPVTSTESRPGVQNLAVLLDTPYSHDETVHLMRRLADLSESGPEDALLLESAALILAAQQPGVRHAAVMKRLCECARLMGVSDTELVHLYLREATCGMLPEEWQKQFTGEEIESWLMLKNTEPQVAQLFSTAELQAYAPSSLPGPDTTLLATADTQEPPPTPEAPAAALPGRVSLIPSPAVGGESLPSVLEKAIPQLPLSITTGTYVVSLFSEGAALQPAGRLELSPDGFRLYISPTETPGVFSLTPGHKDGRPAPLPAVQFSVKGGRLHSVRSGDHEAAVCFPVPENEQFHTNVILVPSFGIPLPEGKGLTLPPAAEAGLEITPEMLEIVPPSAENQVPRLVLRKMKRFPWVMGRNDEEKTRFSLSLPVLSGHNSVEEESDKDTGYVWRRAEVTSETDRLTQFRCEIVYRPDLPVTLGQTFERVANTPCCGEAPKRASHLTLGNLYYIVCALANDKLTRSERNYLHDVYFQLFADRINNKILAQILAQDKALYLTREEATERGLKAVKARRSVGRMLDERQVRDRIRKLVCQVLSRSMMAAYTREQQRITDELKTVTVFTLKHIAVGNHVELLWQFQPEQRGTKQP